MNCRKVLGAALLSPRLAPTPLAAQNVFNPTVEDAPYPEPHIPRPEQEAVAADKLATLEERFGRKPNILIFLVDDMGLGRSRRLWRRHHRSARRRPRSTVSPARV